MNKQQKEILQISLNSEKEVLNKLTANYQNALYEINNKILILKSREDADLQHVIYQLEYQKSLQTQVQIIIDQLQNNNFETVSEYLAQSYENGFIGTLYDLQGQGIPLIFPIEQKQVVAAIQHETKLSEDLYTSLGKDTKVLSKQIAAEISRGISNGAMYSEMARNISNRAGISKNNAMRIARTEAHRIQIKATMDAQWKAKEKGADVLKQWDSTLDGKTRDHHRELDGQIRELDEYFEVAGIEVEAPGMFGDPAEDCNCRCALLQRARWALDEDFTKYSPDADEEISDDGVTRLFHIKAQDYDDFKKQYWKMAESESVRSGAQKMNPLVKSGKSDKIGAKSNVHNPVKYNKNNDYSIHIDGYSDDVNKELSRAAESVASLGTSDGNEHMYLVDLNGILDSYYETNGIPDKVGFDFWAYAAEHPNTKFAFIHNHNFESPLSETDLETPILQKNIPIQIAVRNDGVKYIATRSKMPPAKYIPDEYFAKELEELNAKSRANEITPVERMVEREQIITESLVKEFYGRIEIVDGRK